MKKGFLDKTIAKNCHCEIFDIEVDSDVGDIDLYQECGIDRVILD